MQVIKPTLTSKYKKKKITRLEQKQQQQLKKGYAALLADFATSKQNKKKITRLEQKHNN